jgi:hypothetical protein
MTEDDALALLHDRITETLLAKLPGVVHVEAYPDLEKVVTVPAVFFGMPEFAPGPDSGTGKTAIHGKFQALILVDATDPHAPVQGMWLAARMASLLRGQYWELDYVEETKDVMAALDNSNPALEQFVTWGVSWSQDFHVGDNAEWPWPDLKPTPFGPESPEAVTP